MKIFIVKKDIVMDTVVRSESGRSVFPRQDVLRKGQMFLLKNASELPGSADNEYKLEHWYEEVPFSALKELLG